MTWITVPNWNKFQHYGLVRRPPWIKTYTALLHKDEYLDLPLAARGLLQGIWLAYADRDGLLRVEDIRLALRTRGRLDTDLKHIESLNHAGLIALSASKPLTLKEQEELCGESLDAEKPQPTSLKAVATQKKDLLHQALLDRAQQVAAGWNGGGSDLFADELDNLERECRSHLKSSEREQLWDQVLAKQRR